MDYSNWMQSIEEITINNGPLRFSALTQGSGPLVLCLHGFPDSKNTYSAQLPALAKAGYQAVSVSLRGYESSSLPADNDYSATALAGDVIACLDQLGADQAHLIGHDWGAAIGYTVCEAASQRFYSLTAIALPHNGRFINEAIYFPKQLRLSWYMLFFQLGDFSLRSVRRNDYQMIRRLWRDWCGGSAVPTTHVEDVIQTLQQPGVLEAALEYYRTALSLTNLMPAARAANRFNVPVPTMAISGGRDGCIDSNAFTKMMHAEDFPLGLSVKQIESAGHFPHISESERVNRWIVSWLNEWQK